MEKTIYFRVPTELKFKFQMACLINKKNYAKVFRQFMARYIEENSVREK